MATANARLLDLDVDHAVDLTRFSTGVAYRLMAVLNRADRRLMAELAQAMLQLEAESFTIERLEALLANVRALNAEAYALVFSEFAGQLQGFAEVEASWQTASLRAAVPAAVQLRFPIAGLGWQNVYAAAMSRPFQGRLLSGWAAQLEADRLRLIRNAIRDGFMDGRTTAEIIRTIRGTKAKQYADGLLQRPRRELEAVVRTALSHTAQTARQLLAEQNADLVKAVRWVSTLDSRTSPLCRVRDGLVYSADAKHRPIGHKVPWGAGPGRIHFCCRSTSALVLKSWRELGIDADEMPAGTRASMDGQVPADLRYGDWLVRQSAARQDEILGPERAALLRAGRVRFEQFADDRGKWLTLEELRRRIPGLTLD